MRPLARVALGVALTPAALLALVFADRLWVTAIRPELLNLRARRAGMRIDGAVARSVTVTPREFDAMTEDRPGVVLLDLVAAIERAGKAGVKIRDWETPEGLSRMGYERLVRESEERARAAHEQDMADMAGTEDQ